MFLAYSTAALAALAAKSGGDLRKGTRISTGLYSRKGLRAARGVMAGVVTNGAQALLALALLEKVSMSKKQTGALGVFLSAMNVYKLTPPMKRKTA